jgi:hypothetical protein
MERPITTEKLYKPIPKATLLALLDHQCWLASGGTTGRQFGTYELDIDYFISDEGLEQIDFRDYDLDGFDFSFAELREFAFNGSSLRGAWFIGADLSATLFKDCDATGARFEAANLAGASFIGATCSNARFDDANMYQTMWTQKDNDKYFGDSQAALEEEGDAIDKLKERESKSPADIERIERFNALVKAKEENERVNQQKRQKSLPFWRQAWKNEKAAHPLWRRTWNDAALESVARDSTARPSPG